MSRTRGEEKQRFKVIFGRRPSSCNRNGKTSKLHQTSKCYWSSVCFMRKCFGGEETAKGRRGRESRPVKCAINKTREPEVEQLSTDSLPCPTSWCRRDTSSCFQGEMYHKDKGGKKSKNEWPLTLRKQMQLMLFTSVWQCCAFFFNCFIGTHALEAQFVTTLRKWSLFSHS